MRDYKLVCDALVQVLSENRTGALSEDMLTAVKTVEKGQYVPQYTGDKPVVFVRPETPGSEFQMAGNQVRQDRLSFMISGAVCGTSQSAAYDDAMNLYNNLQNIFMHLGSTQYWSGGRLGWGTGNDENPEPHGKFEADITSGLITVHFWLRWSCSLRIGRGAI